MKHPVVRQRSRRNGVRKKSAAEILRGIKPTVEDRVRFIGGFLRGPAKVGAIAPSSRALARAMVRGCGLNRVETVVELGPGTGAFTRAILEGIGERTTFFAVEVDPIFAQGLRKRFPGLVVYNDSAERLRDYLARNGKTKADCIISGLPWASLPLVVQDRIMESVLASLSPGGVFTTFGYVHARWMPNALRFRRRLLQHFPKVEVSKVVWGNFPPAFVYRCTR
jgi:phospholipid N-methyltransferase